MIIEGDDHDNVDNKPSALALRSMALCWTAKLFCNRVFIIPSEHVICVILHTLLGLEMGRPPPPIIGV
jgi:hypothetical protein